MCIRDRPIGDRCSGRLADNPLHLQPGQLSRALGRFSSGIVKIGGHADYRFRHLLAQKAFRILLQGTQDKEMCIRDRERTLGRQFHPWEGGEGKIPKQYVTALLQLAKEHNARGEYARAEELLRQAAGSYPWNLGEGKLYGAQENHIYYYLGCTLEAQGRAEEAAECFAKASTGISEPVGALSLIHISSNSARVKS